MRDRVIQCDGIGKRYRLGEQIPYRTLRESLMRLLSPRSHATHRDSNSFIWALREISFSVSSGEVVGVVGRNGAGKSTLLKILSRITSPTTGSAEIRGRVGSLLEIGTGFHGELTGRENIFLNGAILGMTKPEVRERFDEIVAFAECERFLETPMKHYSSGMEMRLAFAIAAHLEPEILLMDEVLAVGDSAFQKKCLGRMAEVSRRGRTILFVSHNMVAVQGLCTRAICLDAGRIHADGPPSEVIPMYLRECMAATNEQLFDDRCGPGNDKVRLLRASVRQTHGDVITVRTNLKMEFDYCNYAEGIELDIGVNVYNEQMVLLFSTGLIGMQPARLGVYRLCGVIPGDLLNSGLHSVELVFSERFQHFLFRADAVLRFEVEDSAELRAGWYDAWPGMVRPHIPWTAELIG